MSWELSLRVTYQPPNSGLVWFPGMSDEPCYSFDSRGELVEFLPAMGEAAGLGGLGEYARRVDREGGVMERVLALRRPKDWDTVQKAVDQMRRRNRLGAEISPSAITD